MERCTVVMHHAYPGSLLRSPENELCFALPCPEMTRKRDLKHRML